jgi:mannitol/fructose-specific phosphotransferase system IIA component (Ntr-type)
MKPRCEWCDADLALDGAAWICSFECTFCTICALSTKRVCPNCSEELVARPRRVKGTGPASSAPQAVPQPAAPSPIPAPEVKPAAPRKRLGEQLIAMGLLKPDQLAFALQLQKNEKSSYKLGDYLVQLGFITDQALFDAITAQTKQGLVAGAPAPEPTTESKHRLLGEVLVELKLITLDELRRGIDVQSRSASNERLGDVLIRLGYITRDQVYEALLKQAKSR